MLHLRDHHKQAIIKLINCMTHEFGAMNVMNIDVIQRLIHILLIYEDSFNSQTCIRNEVPNASTMQLIAMIRKWLLSYYKADDFINSLFDFDDNKSSFTTEHEEKLWTITLMILNVMHKMRNCFPDMKMMLELGWICLAELDEAIDSMAPNYNKFLQILQFALNAERDGKKEEPEKRFKLNQEVSELRNRVLDLQRKLMKVGREKALLKSKLREIHSLTTRKFPAPISLPVFDEFISQPSMPAALPGPSTSSTDRKAKGTNLECKMCGKVFSTSYKLNRHMFTHTGERPYPCQWPGCSKQFNDNYHLHRHTMTHTGERPYVCQTLGCNKRFARNEDLRYHQKTHSNDSQEYLSLDGVSQDMNQAPQMMSLQQDANNVHVGQVGHDPTSMFSSHHDNFS